MTSVPPLAVCLCPLIAGLWHSSTQQSYRGDDRELIARIPEYFHAWKGPRHPSGEGCLETGVKRCRDGGQLPLLPDLGQAWGAWILTPNHCHLPALLFPFPQLPGAQTVSQPSSKSTGWRCPWKAQEEAESVGLL